MSYKVEMECGQTYVDPTTGEIGIRSGERRPVGHEDVGQDWKPVIVEVDDESKSTESSKSQAKTEPETASPHAPAKPVQHQSDPAPAAKPTSR